MDEWYESFEGILARHQDDFVAALPQGRESILKTIHDQIVTRHKSLEDPVVLPKPLRKIPGDKQDHEACGVSPEEREVAARPKDAGFYKKELTDWDVMQKLFKEEMHDYDKEEQSKLGVKHLIKFHTGHTRDWFKNMSPAQWKEVENAKDKWNNKGAPAESQAITNSSYDGVSDCDASSKEWTSDGFEKFAEWSKLEFYPEDDNEESDEDDKNDNMKDKLPELVLDKKGYAKLPSHSGIHTKGQQELVCQIFHASYTLMGLTVGWAEVFTKSAKPVPWREVITNPRQLGDMSKASLENAVPYQGNKKKEYKEIDDEDQDPTSAMLSMAHTDWLAESKAAPNASASTCPTAQTKTTDEVEKSEVEERQRQKDQERTELEEKQRDHEVEVGQQMEVDLQKLEEHQEKTPFYIGDN
ncbi:hypothetical protein F4604DRAFT_1687673 [Suillus subluteus]|nr:hypothetical protein F4604DRAFT_1687673 [Suillus subluteus]